MERSVNETSQIILDAVDRQLERRNAPGGRRAADIRLSADWLGYGLWCALGLMAGIVGTLMLK